MAQPSATTVGRWLIDFLEGYENASFKKARDHSITNERSLLKVLKFFFLAKYPLVEPEVQGHQRGRLDFCFGNLALEIAVKNASGAGSLVASQNLTEMRKLRKHYGPACLALINMQKNSTTDIKNLVDGYRSVKLGKGNHKNAKPVKILVISREVTRYKVEQFSVRVRSSI